MGNQKGMQIVTANFPGSDLQPDKQFLKVGIQRGVGVC